MVRGLARLTLALSILVVANAQALKTVSIPLPNTAASLSIPAWSNGLYVQWTRTEGSDRPKLWAYDENGMQVISPTEIWFPDTASARIHAAVASPEKLVIASVLAWTSARMTTLLCFIGPSGVIRVTDTNQFIAEHLAFSPDGVLWAFGFRAVSSPGDVNGDFRTLRRFDINGMQLSESVQPDALVGQRHGGGIQASQLSNNGASFLLAGSSRKFLFNSATYRFLELDSVGRIIRSAILNPLPRSPARVKLLSAVTSASGHIYCTFDDGAGIWNLNPDTMSWTLIDKSNFAVPFNRTYGMDGEQAILGFYGNTFSWFAMPAQ